MTYHLRLLGTRTLLRDGEELPTRLLAQPLRLGVVVYLAMSRLEGREWVSRDELLALFWPDREEAKARKALSQAIWVVRDELGAEIARKRGKGDVSIPIEMLELDVGRFLLHLEVGDPEAALAEYRGDFLAGFHLTAAPEFDRWADGVRSRLRSRALDAAWGLATTARESSDLGAARRHARMALEIGTSIDEGNLRRFMTFVAGLGERSAALEAYDAHASALWAQDDAPLRETAELAERLRDAARATARPARRERYRARASGGGEGVNAIGHEDARRSEGLPRLVPAEPRAPREPVAQVGFRFRSRSVALAALGVAALASLPFLPGARTGSENDAGRRVVVVPFEHRGEADEAYLGEAMVDLLALRLDGVAGLRTVEPSTVFRVLGGTDDPADAVKRFDADLRVEGTVVSVGEGLELQARLIDDRGAVVAETVARAAHDDELLGAVDRVALDLLGRQLEERGEGLETQAAVATSSVEALRAFLQGEAAFRRVEFEAAGRFYEEAVRADSTFALAWFRLSRVGDWTTNADALPRGLAGATRYRDRLPSRTRRLLDGYTAFWRGSIEEGMGTLEALVGDYPFDSEARYQLADARFHGYPRLGRPITESADAFRRTLELNPGDRRAALHLLGLTAYLGRREESRALAEVLGGGDDVWRFRRRALVSADPPSGPSPELLRELQDLAADRVVGAVLAAADFREDPELLFTAGRLARQGAESPAVRLNGAEVEILGLAASGRIGAAVAAAERLLRLDAERGAVALAYLQALPYGPLPDSAAAPMEPASPAVAALTAMALVRAGRVAEARRVVTGIEETADELLPHLREPVRLARAVLVAAEGRPAQALEIIAAARRGGSRLTAYSTSPFHPNAMERFHRARILEMLGREEEALGWYGTMASPTSYSLPWAAPAHLARARILDRMGRRAEAAEAWRRVQGLWESCESQVRSAMELAGSELSEESRSPR